MAFVLPTDSPAVPLMARQRIGAWLTEHGWPADEREDIVYAISEAVTNACEHAYVDGEPGLVSIAARVEHPVARNRRIRVAVADTGHWQPRRPRPLNCGRGLVLINALMEDVQVRRGDADRPGTTLVMTSPAVTRDPDW